MARRSPDRERLDRAQEAWGVLPGLVVLPYIAGYLVAVTTSAGSPHLVDGLFVVVLAVLLIGSSWGRWSHAHRSGTSRVAVMAGATALGLVVGVLVGHGGLG